MAIDSELSALVYNASGRGPYPVPFPILTPDHVSVMRNDIQLTEGQYTVLLESGQWVVRLTFDPVGGDQITVFRLLPVTQPYTFPRGGEFRTDDVERALDHQTMVIQQILRIVTAGIAGTGYLPSVGEGQLIQDVLVWADDAARALVVPGRAGRLGVQMGNKSLYIANSATMGDWVEYAARPTIAKRVRIGFVSDAGNATSPNQAAAVARLVSENVDFVVLGGDNTGYRPGDTYDSDHAAFRVFPASKRAEVWGNHDGPLALWQLRLATEYPNDPRNITGKPYGVISIGGLVDIFLQDSSMESDGSHTHPDGYAVGSPQHTAFLTALAASTAPRKIAFFHHPMVSDAYGSNRVVPGMAWPELTHMDVIGLGHAHGLSMMDWRGTLLANCSHITQGADAVTWLLQGDSAEVAKTKILYTNPDDTAVCIMDVTADGVSVAFIRISDGATLIRRNHNELLAQERTVQEYMVYNAAVPIESGVEHYAGTVSAATFIERIMVSVASPSSGTIGCTLSAGGNVIASMIILAGERYAETTSFTLPGYFLIPVGTPLTLLINETIEYGATQATGLNLHLSTTHPKW